MSTTDDKLTRLFIEAQRRLDENRGRATPGGNASARPVVPEEGGRYLAPGSKPEEPLERLRRANRGSTIVQPSEQPLVDDELGGHTRDSFNRLPAERRLQIANEAYANRKRRA